MEIFLWIVGIAIVLAALVFFAGVLAVAITPILIVLGAGIRLLIPLTVIVLFVSLITWIYGFF